MEKQILRLNSRALTASKSDIHLLSEHENHQHWELKLINPNSHEVVQYHQYAEFRQIALHNSQKGHLGL